MTKQKFRRYQFVYVSKEKQGRMSVRGGFTGIISGSYSDQFGGKGVNTYTIYKLNGESSPEDAKVVDCCSWFAGWQLKKLLFQNTELAAEMIEAYNLAGVAEDEVEEQK